MSILLVCGGLSVHTVIKWKNKIFLFCWCLYLVWEEKKEEYEQQQQRRNRKKKLINGICHSVYGCVQWTKLKPNQNINIFFFLPSSYHTFGSYFSKFFFQILILNVLSFIFAAIFLNNTSFFFFCCCGCCCCMPFFFVLISFDIVIVSQHNARISVTIFVI